MPRSYSYLPLLAGSSQIRVLTLHPGGFSDEIVISLEHVELGGPDAPPYEALSYVWGSPEDPVQIAIKARPSRLPKSLLITQNLDAALRHLRASDEPRVLWVDAICIDQGNLKERSEQVARMANIFRLASKGVIWLGPEADGSDIAMDTLSDLSSKVEVDFRTGALKSVSDGRLEPHWTKSKQALVYGEQAMRAFQRLIFRPWFERLWVLQEAQSANLDTVTQCGSKTLLWKSFLSSVITIRIKGFRISSTIGYYNRLDQLVRAFDPSDVWDLSRLTRNCRMLKCQDDRDRVYGLLGILPPGDLTKGVTPDYTLSTQQVYKSVAWRHASNGSLQLIEGCDLGTRRLEGPTWVPDWANMSHATPIERGSTANFVCGRAALRENGSVLRVAGLQCATLSMVTQILQLDSPTLGDVCRTITEIAPDDVLTATYPTGTSLLEAFCSTIIAADLEEWDPPRGRFYTKDTAMTVIEAIVRESGVTEGIFGSSADKRNYLDTLVAITGRRAFFYTSEGYIGLGPSAAAQGDIVCVVFGCSLPMLLRPTIGSNLLKVVGACFVPGFSQREAILGPLPEHVRFTSRYSEPSGYYLPAFHNIKTGEKSSVDPRLRALGIDPELNLYGIPLMLKLEQLEAAGVHVKYLDLI